MREGGGLWFNGVVGLICPRAIRVFFFLSREPGGRSSETASVPQPADKVPYPILAAGSRHVNAAWFEIGIRQSSNQRKGKLKAIARTTAALRLLQKIVKIDGKERSRVPGPNL